jgi:hypothetical protein
MILVSSWNKPDSRSLPLLRLRLVVVNKRLQRISIILIAFISKYFNWFGPPALHDLLCKTDLVVIIVEHIIFLILCFENLVNQVLIWSISCWHVHQHSQYLIAQGLWVVAMTHSLQVKCWWNHIWLRSVVWIWVSSLRKSLYLLAEVEWSSSLVNFLLVLNIRIKVWGWINIKKINSWFAEATCLHF